MNSFLPAYDAVCRLPSRAFNSSSVHESSFEQLYLLSLLDAFVSHVTSLLQQVSRPTWSNLEGFSGMLLCVEENEKFPTLLVSSDTIEQPKYNKKILKPEKVSHVFLLMVEFWTRTHSKLLLQFTPNHAETQDFCVTMRGISRLLHVPKLKTLNRTE